MLARMHVPLSVTISATDSAGEILTITASVKNSDGVQQLTQTNLGATGNSESGMAVYTTTLEWTPTMRDTYTLEISVEDTKETTTVIKPFFILCDCQNNGECKYDEPMVS